MSGKRSGQVSKPKYIDTGAVFSICEQYRYTIWRCWDINLPSVLFIGLNPSTANATNDDPTLRRCIDFARKWEYGSVYVVNLFAFRTTNPKILYRVKDPVGPRNNVWIRNLIKRSNRVFVAWGNVGSYNERSKKVLKLIPEAYCLSVNRSGQPSHPLYLPKSVTPKLFHRGGSSESVS